MAGGDVDSAGAGVGGDEIREDDFRSAVEEGMLRVQAVEEPALHFGQHFC